MRYWALGDIHGNASALRAALALVDADPADQVVFLGDLLTYGPEPEQVVELVAERVAQGASCVLGNHDQLYLELAEGAHDYYDRLSPWIRASVDWTMARIDMPSLRGLPFVLEVPGPGVLFAHANPWAERPARGPRWAYLNTEADHALAAEVLAEREVPVGVFGHTHRSRVVEMPQGRGLGDDERREVRWRPQQPEEVLLLNAGSVGQPRNRRAQSTLLGLERHDDGSWSAQVHPLAYDVEGHLARTRALPLPEEGIARLVRFFTPADDASGRTPRSRG